MLHPEFVQRVESEMTESGGSIAADDHENVWTLLKFYAERCGKLEYAISPTSRRPIADLLKTAEDRAHRLHPALSRDEALNREVGRRAENEQRAEDARRRLSL